MKPWRVALVDDHEIVRLGLRDLVNHQSDMRVTCECSTVAEAISIIPQNAEVAVVDIRLPDGSGLEVCRELLARDPGIHVIILTAFGMDDLVGEALDSGATGYILKGERRWMVIEGIRTVAQGGSIFSSDVTRAVLHHMVHPDAATDPIAELTPQEWRVLQLIAEGKTNREIGCQMTLSEKTVKHYVSRLLSKLGHSRRSEAAAHYARYQSTQNSPH